MEDKDISTPTPAGVKVTIVNTVPTGRTRDKLLATYRKNLEFYRKQVSDLEKKIAELESAV